MGTSRRATIADVAAQAGVGVGTVSRVLNGGPNVSEATRGKVVEVMRRLGYRPSHLAVGLSRGTPHTVAIVVPYLTRPSVVTRLAGALAVFDERGYDTIVCNVETPQQRDRHLQALIARHRADGVMVVSLPLAKRHLISFEQATVPLVMIDADASSVPRTVIDDILGGRLATEHLLSLGHRRIGFIGDTVVRGSEAELMFLSLAAAAGRVSPCAARGGSHLRRGPGEVRCTRRADGGGTRGPAAGAAQAAIGDLRGF